MSDEKIDDTYMIKVNTQAEEGDVVRGILQRVVDMLDALLKKDEPGHIDLGQLNLSLDNRELLLEMLGENGTRAEVLDYGHSLIRSTGITGVWWVQHLDGMEQVISEFIEVNYCPEVLIAVTEDVREGRDALKARLFEANMASKRKRRNSSE
jgi:hypothetical protein